MIDEYVRVRPAPALRPYVAFYSGYRQAGVRPGVHRGLPSPYLTLILTLDEPLVILSHPDPRAPGGRFDALLGGLHTRPAVIVHDGWQSGIQVAVRPLGCRALLGLPAGELAGLDVEAEAVLGPVTELLRARMAAAASWPQRFAALDAALAGRLREAAPGPEVAYAWRAIVASGGTVPVARLAARVGWSGRYLTAKFRAEVGLAPKAAARVVRFDRARRLAGPGVRLADIAATCGYTDQAHLARDFREFAGIPAGRWLREEFGFVQAMARAGDDDDGHER